MSNQGNYGKKGWAGPYIGTLVAEHSRIYPKSEKGNECIWLMFKLDGHRSKTGQVFNMIPFKGYKGKGEKTDQRIQEALEACGYTGHFSELTDEDIKSLDGAQVFVKTWMKDGNGEEYETATYVNQFDPEKYHVRHVADDNTVNEPAPAEVPF